MSKFETEMFENLEPSIMDNRKVVSEVFGREAVNGSRAVETVYFSPREREVLEKKRDILLHPGLQSMIGDGKIAFTAYKPHAEISRLGIDDDALAAQSLQDKTREAGFELIFTATFVLNREDAEIFYPHVKQILNRRDWNKMVDDLTSGPFTYALLYKADGTFDQPGQSAPEQLRALIGPTNPERGRASENETERNSIRAKYALDIAHNLMHGSSGPTKGEFVANITQEKNFVLAKHNNLLLTSGVIPDFGSTDELESEIAMIRSVETRNAVRETIVYQALKTNHISVETHTKLKPTKPSEREHELSVA